VLITCIITNLTLIAEEILTLRNQQLLFNCLFLAMADWNGKQDE